MLDDTDQLIAAILGWGMILALPVALVIMLAVQGCNREWRKHLHKLKVDARWAEICAQRDIQSGQ